MHQMILQTKTAYITSQKACATNERRRTFCVQNYEKYVTIGYLFSSFNVKRLDECNKIAAQNQSFCAAYRALLAIIGCCRHVASKPFIVSV